MVAQRFENAAHDAVAARVDFDTGLLAVGGGDVAHSIGVDGTVVEFYTVGNVLHVFLADGLIGPHLVDFLLDILRVSELGSQVTVVGEQQYTSGVAVQTSHRIDALFTGTFHEIHDGFAAVGIVTGCDTVFGLVKQDVALLFGGYDFTVIFNDILGRDLHAEFCYHDIVDHDKAFLDIFISNTARADAGIGHELVQANFHVGIDSGLLIENTLGLGGKAHLGLGTLALGALLIAALALLVTTLTLLVSALTLLVTALTLLVTTGALLIAALTLLVTTLLTGLITALTLLVTSLLTGLITALALLVTALTGLIALTLLVTTLLTGLITLTLLVAAFLLLFGIHSCTFGISVLFACSLRLRITLLIAGLVATLTLLVTALTGLIAALTLLVTALTGLITLTMVTAGTLLITLLLLITFSLGIVLFTLTGLMRGVFYLFITTAFNDFFRIVVALANSWPLGLFQIVVHIVLKLV